MKKSRAHAKETLKTAAKEAEVCNALTSSSHLYKKPPTASMRPCAMILINRYLKQMNTHWSKATSHQPMLLFPFPMQAQPPQQTTSGDPIAPDTLHVATVNVRGLHTSKLLMMNIIQGTYGPPPHILVMTETKLISRPHRKSKVAKTTLPWMKIISRTHHIVHSKVQDVNSPQAGVTVAIDKNVIDNSNVTRVPTDPALEGFLLHIQLEMPTSNPFHIVGIYCPPEHETTQRRWCPTRMQLYQECGRIAREYPASQHTIMIAGDFNAVLHDQDRVTTNKSTGTDRIHQQFVEKLHLHSAEPPPPAGPAPPPNLS